MVNNHVYLYVEDDPMSRQALELILRRIMHINHLYVFENTADFMARLQALPLKPTFVLLDIHMAPYTGFEVLTMLRQHPDYQNTIVIALTASVMNEEVALLKQSGFDGVIGKPIQVTSFPDLIQRVLNGESIWHISDL